MLRVSTTRSRLTVPRWLTADWPLVAAASSLTIAGLLLVCGLYGMVLTTVTTGDPGAAIEGLIAGFYFAFAALGASVRLVVLSGDADVAISLSSVPLGLTLVAAGVVWFALKTACDRLQSPPASLKALAVKVVAVTTLIFTVLASLLSLTDPDGIVVADVDARRTLVGSVLVLGTTAFAFVARRGTITLPPWVIRSGLDRVARALRTGVVAFLGLAAVAGSWTIVGAIVAGDSGAERLRLVLGLPVVGINLMLTSGVAALGTTVAFGVAQVSDVFGAGFGGAATGTMSLFRYGFPPGASTGSAPFLVLVAFLLLGPGLLAGAIARQLRDEPPQAAVVGTWLLLAGVGFVSTAAVAGLLGRIELFADARGLGGGTNFVVIRPDLVTTLGYAALWSVLGSLGGWWTWFVLRARGRDAAQPEETGPLPSDGAVRPPLDVPLPVPPAPVPARELVEA